MSVDFRSRRDIDEHSLIDVDEFFSSTLAQALEKNAELLIAGLEYLNLKPFTFDVDGKKWTLIPEENHIVIKQGSVEGATLNKMTVEDFDGLIRDWFTPMTFFTGGTLNLEYGTLEDYLNYWLVLRSALDGCAIYTPGNITFLNRQGQPLDLKQSFAADDNVEDMSHFLHEAGFLHIREVFSSQEMSQIYNDMDAAIKNYRDGDGRSWWAETAEGEKRLVRMQYFSEYSALTAKILEDPRFKRLAQLTGDGHIHQGLGENKIEALIKPLHIVKGISDLPWHKDCSLGRHSYDCCSLTVGISVTGADASSGQLRVLAGSHRALIWPALLNPENYDLPDIDLPTATGDITIHLSCTMHMAQAPSKQERRVMYTGFRLPCEQAGASQKALQRISAVREGAYTTVSQ